MRLQHQAAAALLLSTASLPLPANADEETPVDWSCACLTFDGSSENCHMFATVSGPVFSFGAFETSGDGTYTVERTADVTIVTGKIRTMSGSDMTVIIATPKEGPSLVFTGERKPGGETFTAKCEGKLPK